MKWIRRITALWLLLTGLTIYTSIWAKGPRVVIVAPKKGDYQMLVEGNPYIVRGVCYNPVPIGQGYDYNFWADPGKPWINVDGPLMKKMGVNTIRIYKPGENPDQTKQLIYDMYTVFNIRTIMTHYLGFWDYPSPNYALKEVRDKIKQDVLNMVKEYKDEEGILMWCLGNENNFSFGPQKVNPWSTARIDAIKDPRKKRVALAKIYYQFVGELAKAIKEIDPDHPVMLGNGGIEDIQIARKYAAHIDVLGPTVYRGKTFSSFFREVENKWGKPVIFMEFGCDSYDTCKQVEDQEIQAVFIRSQWLEISRNFPGNKEGQGNCLGGCVFEWMDEWWKASESDTKSWQVHDTSGQWCNGAYYFDIKADGNQNMNEEWWGIVSLDLVLDPYGNSQRVPKKSYYVLQEMWLQE